MANADHFRRDKPFTAGELTLHDDPAEMHRVTSVLRKTGRRVALVPTMGALHAGHLELVQAAKSAGNTVVVVSIFVNPLQFGAGEDLEAYPRTLDRDLELLDELGVELVFAPTAAAVYPNGPRTTVVPGPAGTDLEAHSRPTHFAGMLTVVLKLLNIVVPNAAYFGEKDYQQLVLVGQMVDDLDVDTEIIGVPTVREADGLALSSRNTYLSADQREVATALSAALVAGAHSAADGAEKVVQTARSILDLYPDLEVDYLELRSPTLGPAPEQGDARLLVAARIGSTRLLDNVGVALGTGFRDRDPMADWPQA